MDQGKAFSDVNVEKFVQLSLSMAAHRVFNRTVAPAQVKPVFVYKIVVLKGESE